MTLNAEQKKSLLATARKSIEAFLKNGRRLDFQPHDSVLLEKRGLFVTLKKNGRLRGCIGYPLPLKPLNQALVEMALAAAFEDPRFPPLQADELDQLEIEISLLTRPQAVDDPARVQVGRDGVIVGQGGRRGLLLPQVAPEQGWDREELLSHCCLKAGLAADDWRKPGVSIEIFQAEIITETGQSD